MKGASRNLVTLFYAPKRFFQARAEDRGGSLQATGFALALMLGSSVFEWAWYRLGWSMAGREFWFHASPGFVAAQVALVAVVLPIEAAAVHLLLHGLGAARASFGATYRVCAYSQAGAVCSVFPYVGTALGTLCGLVLLVIGIRETHGTTTGGAILVTSLGMLRLVAIALLAILGTYAMLHYH